jgi:hypothetical protein
VALFREPAGQRNLGQRQVAINEEFARALDTTFYQPSMRGKSRRLPECAGKMAE